jgi:hypothetical protein
VFIAPPRFVELAMCREGHSRFDAAGRDEPPPIQMKRKLLRSRQNTGNAVRRNTISSFSNWVPGAERVCLKKHK